MWSNDKAAVHQRVYYINSSNKNLLLNKYLFYWWKKNKEILNFTAVGSTVKSLRKSNFENPKINLPTIDEQQKIIDIIEPIEKLFIKYPKIIRINNFKNCKKDVKNLIDIIEPMEKIELNIEDIIKFMKKILINKYKLSNPNKNNNFLSFVELLNSRYEKQKIYFATNAIGEFKIYEDKKQYLDKKIPSRANISPDKNTFIISKLMGENKLMFFENKPKEVFSTGFFNFRTNYIDHISGFLLSNNFKKQKELLSTGTTMKGLNNNSLSKIFLNEPILNSNELTILLIKLLDIHNKIEKIKIKIISLLIN